MAACHLARLLCVAAVLHFASAGCVHTGKTYNLDEDSFDDFVFKSDHLVTFVEFSSPWCIWAHPNQNGHGDCATMRDAWDQLGETYNSSHAVSVAEVDCSRFVTHPPEPDGTIRSRTSLCQRFDIKSYPTVFIFTGETGVQGELYKGKQTYEAMHAFLEKERTKLCLLNIEKGTLEPGPACGADEQKFVESWRDKTPDAALEELLRLEAIVSNHEVRLCWAVARARSRGTQASPCTHMHLS